MRASFRGLEVLLGCLSLGAVALLDLARVASCSSYVAALTRGDALLDREAQGTHDSLIE
jgi:hypothetical protein